MEFATVLASPGIMLLWLLMFQLFADLMRKTEKIYDYARARTTYNIEARTGNRKLTDSDFLLFRESIVKQGQTLFLMVLALVYLESISNILVKNSQTSVGQLALPTIMLIIFVTLLLISVQRPYYFSWFYPRDYNVPYGGYDHGKPIIIVPSQEKSYKSLIQVILGRGGILFVTTYIIVYEPDLSIYLNRVQNITTLKNQAVISLGVLVTTVAAILAYYVVFFSKRDNQEELTEKQPISTRIVESANDDRKYDYEPGYDWLNALTITFKCDTMDLKVVSELNDKLFRLTESLYLESKPEVLQIRKGSLIQTVTANLSDIVLIGGTLYAFSKGTLSIAKSGVEITKALAETEHIRLKTKALEKELKPDKTIDAREDEFRKILRKAGITGPGEISMLMETQANREHIKDSIAKIDSIYKIEKIRLELQD